MPDKNPWSRPVLLFSGSPQGLASPQGGLPPLRLVQPPRSVRWVAGLLAALAPLLGLLLLAAPWEQTAAAEGSVIALDPAQREMSVESPVKGRISRWRVQEGDRVRAGDPLADLQDNDPEYLERLQSERLQVQEQLQATREKIGAYRLKRAAEELARDLAVAEYEAKILSLEQKLAGEEGELEAARINLERIQTLASEGIESERKRELEEMYARKAEAVVESSRSLIESAGRAKEKAREVGNSKIAAAEAELLDAEAKLAELQAKALEVESKIARQEAQILSAPADGYVLRLSGGPGGAQIKQGDLLVTLVPESAAPAVALYIDGNDMPLIREGSKVRLIFEGWPAVQFSGWPGMSLGTFGGQIASIDASGEDGKFRALVVPDPQDLPWPDPAQLRQGVRAQGWMMLGQVPLGYEIWRQINGFPPKVQPEKGSGGAPPSSKKPRAPKELK